MLCLSLLAALLTGLVPLPAAADPFADGFAAQQQNQFQEARRQYTAATRAADAGAEEWFHLGLVESLLDDPAAAVRAYQRALDLDPDSPFAYRFRTNLGWAAIAAEETDRGIGELVAVAAARPEEFQALANAAHALFLHGEAYNRAEEWYQRLADMFPTKRGERPLVERWLREAKQNATIVKIGTGFDVYRGIIVGGQFRGRTYGPSPTDNVLVLRTLAGQETTIRKSQIRSFTPEPKYKGMGRSVRSADDLREPFTYDAITYAENMRTGRALLKGGQPARAARQFSLAERKRPGAVDARFAHAVALYTLKDYEPAIELFEMAVGDPATAPRAHYYLVSAYANHAQDLPAALGHALAYIELPKAPRARAIETAAIKITQQLIAQHRGQPEVRWTAPAGLRLDRSEHRRVLGLAFLKEGEPGPALRHLGAAAEIGRGVHRDRALGALEVCLTQLETGGRVTPSVTFYRGYLQFAAGRLDDAGAALEAAQSDPRAKTLLALVRAHQQRVEEARALLAAIEPHDLPGPTQQLYDVADAILAVPRWYARDLKAQQKDAFTYARIGAANGLGVYSDTLEGDLMPIIAVCTKNGRGQLEVNGNPLFDLFSVISFKEAFDWVGNEVDNSFPNQWDTTITFGGLSLYLAKGGDSAGCAIALALCSAVTEQRVLQNVAVTGAIRLDGRVEPVGEVQAKVLAAVSQDIRTIIVPEANVADLGAPDGATCSRVKFITVSSIATARYHAFGPSNPETAEAYAATEERFRRACLYYRLGAYALARPDLHAVLEATPENYSARRLLELMGDAAIGPMVADAVGG